ncbi:MAG: PSD1 and planctomycete cytochrome C domain-containing protein [Chthoniobacteraceae bacterium]
MKAPALAFLPIATVLLAAEPPIPAKPEYNRDVRPILADACFRCHGFDKNTREADLRLDVREAAVAKIDGIFPIMPGKPADSEVWRRITASDKDDLMPPAKEHRQLSAREKEILKRWIEQGAEYQPHWAYIAPAKAAPPDVKQAGFVRGAIDQFVLARQQRSLGLEHAGEADRATLARRLYLDLLGLPPTPAEVDAFAKDAAPDATGKLVEKLLASPQFGERMAVWWLDLARFADTIGYHSDNPHDVWPYRDYVIAAFNENKRFDRFTLEQIAGDLLPDATLQTRVASTFNRLNMRTQEGGAQPKQYEAKTVTDRVKAIGTVWLGQTFMCAECHDHKFDPVTARDFYALGAFFADVKETPIGREEETIIVADDATLAKLKSLDEALAKTRAKLAERVKVTEPEQPFWEFDLNERIGSNPKEHGIPKDLVAALKVEKAKRNPKQKQALDDYIQRNHPLLAPVRKALDAAEVERKRFFDPLPKTIATVSTAPEFRTVRLLPRGDWMKEDGEVVLPTMPAYLDAKSGDAANATRLTRLDLAKWLVARNNPLTARVVVNRLWKQFFGIGLCKTLDDLGTQGELPPNQALLDWLACEFMDSGWDVKHIVKLMLTSGAYRQSSVPTKALVQRDPENRAVTRAGRWRLDAEFLRDNALSVSGLLVQKLGGPSVKPYQPAGYWENLNFPVREWANDKGPDQWRRGLYTWWQRSYLHPALMALDAPSREECTAERVRSNIPQQALVLLNDPTYVEAARAFAGRIIAEGGDDTDERLAWAWRQATQREAKPDELALIAKLFEDHKQSFAEDAAGRGTLLNTGYAPAPKDANPTELAAWTSVARALLNLHETITRS